MNQEEYAKIVSRMQQFITAHIDETFALEEVTGHVGYSPRHAKRLFKQFTGRSLSEYIRLMKMTDAARQLLVNKENILEVALSKDYESHEGFTKAFSSAFGVSPQEYRKSKPPVPYFMPQPAHHYFHLIEGGTRMNANIKTCTATYIEKPERKLIYLPSNTASDYMTFCQEKGCEWHGILNSIPGRFTTEAIITLPDTLATPGESRCAAAVEVPADYNGKIPEGYRIITLAPVTMVNFVTAPYENEEHFCEAIESAYHAYSGYRPEQYGYRYAPELAPAFNFGATAATGARLAYPVEKINS